jgi:hypothetical protein
MKGNIHGGKQLGQDKKQLTVFITEELHAKLIESAKAKELTISDLTRIALKEYLARDGA